MWGWLLLPATGHRISEPWWADRLGLLELSGRRVAAWGQVEVSPTWLVAAWRILLSRMTAAGLWRSGIRAPRVPAGDIVVVGDRAARSLVVCAKAIEAVDGRLRAWPVACLSLLFVVFLLAAALWAWP